MAGLMLSQSRPPSRCSGLVIWPPKQSMVLKAHRGPALRPGGGGIVRGHGIDDGLAADLHTQKPPCLTAVPASLRRDGPSVVPIVVNAIRGVKAPPGSSKRPRTAVLSRAFFQDKRRYYSPSAVSRSLARTIRVATSAREALPWGSSAPAPLPVSRPFSTAQAMACSDQSLTAALSA